MIARGHLLEWSNVRARLAKRLVKEIRQTYEDAIDHRGRPMVELAEAAEKELGITK